MPEDQDNLTTPQAVKAPPQTIQPFEGQKPQTVNTSQTATPPQTPQASPEPSIVHPQPQTAPELETPQKQAPPPPLIYPKSTAKIFLTIIAILFFATVITFGSAITAAYYNYPLVTPPKIVKDAIDKVIAISPLPKPKRLIIESAFAKTASIKTADVKTELSMTANSQNSPVELVKLTVEGPAELDNPLSKATEFDIALEIGFEGASFNGSASVKTVENRLYFKINEIPFGTFHQELTNYKNKWYYWDIPEKYKEKEENKEISENVNKLITSFVQNSQQWTTLTSKEGQHYTLEVKPPAETITNLIYDIIQVYEPKDQKQLAADLEKESITVALKKVNNLKITLKIEKDTYYLSSINAQFELAIDDFSSPASTINLLPQEQTIFNFNLAVKLSNYNKNIVIIPPEGAINIETVMKELSKLFNQQLPEPLEELPPQFEPLPSPEPTSFSPGTENRPDGTGSGIIKDNKSLHGLISPEETILGEKYGWEKELLKLFASIIN